MQAVLVMFRSDGDRRSFSLTRDITVIGRREDCDLRIPLGEVSRKHCRLVRDGDTLRLEDLGSSNGTYHNGQRVQEAMLSPGDSIQVGPLVFVLQIDGVPVDEELAPVVAGTETAHEDQLLEDDSPLQPTAQSEYGMGELPTLDDEPAAELEPLQSGQEDEELTPLGEAEELTPLGEGEELTPLAESEGLPEPMGLEDSEPDALGGLDEGGELAPESAGAHGTFAGAEENGAAATQPLDLEAPAAGGELSFDDLEAVPELESAAPGEGQHAEEPPPGGEHVRSTVDYEIEPLALDDLDVEQAPLELVEGDEQDGHVKLDAEHESPHTH